MPLYVIAVASASPPTSQTLRVQGTQAAGDPPLALASPLHCIEIMTGAMLPAGCDAVVPVERISVSNGEVRIEDGLAVTPGMNIHHRGSDLTQGTLILSSGLRLESPQVAAAAGAGMARLRVSQQPAFMVDRKSTRLNSTHLVTSYAAFCLKKKKKQKVKSAVYRLGALR